MENVKSRRFYAYLGRKKFYSGFFGRFVARFVNFYLSRAATAALGGSRLPDLAEIAEFNEALRTHCDQGDEFVPMKAVARAISFGGFLGMGDKRVALRWNAFHFCLSEKHAVLNVVESMLADSLSLRLGTPGISPPT